MGPTRQIWRDIENLRFYARMASEFAWSTDVISCSVINTTLSEIANRLRSTAERIEKLEQAELTADND